MFDDLESPKFCNTNQCFMENGSISYKIQVLPHGTETFMLESVVLIVTENGASRNCSAGGFCHHINL